MTIATLQIIIISTEVIIMANVNFKMNDELKSDFETACERMGLNVSTVLNLFAREVVKEQGIPFKISCKPNAGAIENYDEEKGALIALSRLLDQNEKVLDFSTVMTEAQRIYE